MAKTESSSDKTAPPSNSGGGFPVVGLGASAGGVQALAQFFSNIPADSGMAFVVVTHQHATRKSMLHEIVGRKTAMPVCEVMAESTLVEPNHVYIAPPGFNLAIVGGALQRVPPDQHAPLRLPIDHFFRSLAADQKEHAVGIVLSGTGSDGTLGLKEIKGALGMVMAQQEESATYADMPHSAIGTGLVDYVLPAHEMPRQLIAYFKGAVQARKLEVPEAKSPTVALERIFALLRDHTRHDFSEYKASTVRRRIERRMNVHNFHRLEDYIHFLDANAGEIDLLFKELLIGVTSFFRDAGAFDALAKALPELLASKTDSIFRGWIAGCSTGEEAYSIAMLLRECLDEFQRPMAVQLFATDLDDEAIDVARAGIFPLGIVNDVTPKRLERFFTRDEETFRIDTEIRDTIVFAKQNLTQDPPFTKLDLLSCRNLLIYLETSLQRRLLPVFHYSLKPDGILFLGPSESIGGFDDLFEPIDKKWRVFRRKPAASKLTEVPVVVDAKTPRPQLQLARGTTSPRERQMDALLLSELVPPTVVVQTRGDIVHIHGRTGRFLEPAPGPQPSSNIFSMAREGLGIEIGAAIRQAATQHGEVVRRGVPFTGEGQVMLVDVRVRRVEDSEPHRGLYLVTFDLLRTPGPADQPPGQISWQDLDGVGELTRELQFTRESHRATVEELETANEELRSANEELQSTNEELQSTIEELETTKEETQSLNEELQTLNFELQAKLDELSRANDDMKNLLDGTDIATLFLDRNLRIKRFTKQATRVIHLIASDMGRPISDLSSRLRYDRLVEDAREVLSTLVFKESEVQGEDDSWYLARILPYRTAQNVIDGLVITFVNITAVKRLQENERRFSAALQNSPVAVFAQDAMLRYVWVGEGAFGRGDAGQIIGKSDGDLFSPSEAEALTAMKRRVLDTGNPTHVTLSLTVAGAPRLYALYIEPMRDRTGVLIGLSGVALDMTSLDQRT